jgi:hypothetical protein
MNRQQWFPATVLGVFDRTKPRQKNGPLNSCQSRVCGVEIVSIALGYAVNDESNSTS